MKEFVKKLIERLEELSGKAEQEMNYYRELPEKDASCEVFADSHEKEYEAYCKAMDIVNQLAEEYNNYVCEWKWGVDYADVQCKGDRIIFGRRRLFNYCPYCGKQIKVVE